MTTTGRNTWSRFVAVARPFFRSEVRRRGVALLALLIGLLLAVSGLNVINSYVGRDFMTALSQRQAGRVSSLALLYVGVFAASTVVAVFERFTERHLGLLWRQWLTRHLTDRYLTGHAYYHIDPGGAVDNPDQRIAEDIEDGERVAFEHLTLQSDDGRVLVKDLPLEVPRGRRLLVKGPNGGGRTMLLRAAAGLCPDGKGRVIRPPRDEVMFLPHHPYLVHGTLRDLFRSAAGAGGATDDRIRAVLREVKFEHVLGRVGGLDAERNWSKVLSTSEQLVAFARQPAD
jgi:ABC-type uncharacterized transport system fused permease/ATPase subunit